MSYRQGLEKYRDLDEDQILGALTEDEIKVLEDELLELDPDVSALKNSFFKSSIWGFVVTFNND